MARIIEAHIIEDCLAALTLSAFLGALLFWSALAEAALVG